MQEAVGLGGVKVKDAVKSGSGSRMLTSDDESPSN